MNHFCTCVHFMVPLYCTPSPETCLLFTDFPCKKQVNVGICSGHILVASSLSAWPDTGSAPNRASLAEAPAGCTTEPPLCSSSSTDWCLPTSAAKCLFTASWSWGWLTCPQISVHAEGTLQWLKKANETPTLATTMLLICDLAPGRCGTACGMVPFQSSRWGMRRKSIPHPQCNTQLHMASTCRQLSHGHSCLHRHSGHVAPQEPLG